MHNTKPPKKGTSQTPAQVWTNKTILTYKDIEPIVEYLVKVKARDNTFDCWDADDVAQEIRIICLNAIPHFDSEKVDDYKGVVNYFGRCVDNRLRNLKRDNYIRFCPPFSKEKVKELEDNPGNAPQEYEKLEKFKEGLEVQKKIKHPANIEVVGEHNGGVGAPVEEEVAARDTRRYLLENIEENLRPALITLLLGDKRKVNIRIRKRIQASVRDILEE